jgi:DNA-directed RNA polymerase delta subunit
LVNFQGSDIRNRKFLNQIHLLELEKEKLEKQGQTKLTSTEILEEITKAQGVLRNEDNTTVLQYFTLIKKLSKWHR